jgi:hypothetical protein
MESGLILTLSTVRARPANSSFCCRCRGCRTQLLRTRISLVFGPRHHPCDTEGLPLRSKRHPRANPRESGVRGVCGQVRFLGSKTAALTSPTPPAGRRIFNIVAGPCAPDRSARGTYVAAMRCPRPQKSTSQPQLTL